MRDQDLIDELGEVAVEHLDEPVRREVDAVVGDPVLREVVGPDLLGALAGAHLAAAVLRHGVVLLLHLHLVETRAQHLERLRAVLDLRLLVLLRHDEAGGDVRDAAPPSRSCSRSARRGRSSRRCRRAGPSASIWMSTSSASGSTATVAVEVWMRPLRLGLGHALHAVHAALVLQAAVHLAALDHDDRFLDAAAARSRSSDISVDPPALALGEARVHPEQIGREQRGLVAARARPDLEHDVLLVVRVLGHEQEPDCRRG